MTSKPIASPVLKASKVSATYGARPIIDTLNCTIEPGSIAALIGPNGSGKSTLLKLMARLLPIAAGAVTLDGKAIHVMPGRDVARMLAVLPQGPAVPESLTVRELVEQGRYPHTGPFRPLRDSDRTAVDRALTLCDLQAFADRDLGALSGGERQRAWIALALAQNTPILLLDEPTTYLDIRHQIDILELVHSLNRNEGITILMVLHDLNQAARYADRIIVMRDGQIFADGSPEETVTAETIAEVFEVDGIVVADPITGTPSFCAGRAIRSK